MRGCYESGLLQVPGLEGRLALSFDITPFGQTTNIRVQSASVKSPLLEQCLVRLVTQIRFPNGSGEPIRVVYPLIFSLG